MTLRKFSFTIRFVKNRSKICQPNHGGNMSKPAMRIIEKKTSSKEIILDLLSKAAAPNLTLAEIEDIFQNIDQMIFEKSASIYFQ